MSFLNKDTPDKWEKKYFSLLDEQDTLEKAYAETEELLCKTITRLSLAATGFNKELDPYLNRIRKQLKKGLKNDKLKQELEEFSKALLTLDDSSMDNKDNPALLFKFLNSRFPKRQAELERIYLAYENKHYANTQYLLLALHELVDEEQSVVSEIHHENINTTIINKHLLHLLESTEIPEQFISQAEQLKIRLQNEVSLSPVFEDTVSILLSIKKHYQAEQQKMAEFLTHLNTQLAELGNQANGTAKAADRISKKRNLLDQSFSKQMFDLQETSAKATKLEPLKQLVKSRLEGIAQQLQAHQQQERLEKQKAQQNLQLLTSKIQDMEARSSELKNKLEQAYKQATHDPLTGLPNRLAYDERLELEIARFHRNQTPLSLVIWDIDFFKKINDTYGHKAGDKTLQIIAKLLAQNCRETDFVSRFGGEEFTMLLPDTDAQAAYIIAEKLRKTIEKTGFNSNGNKIQITVSCGISQFTKEDSGDSVFKRADQALYQAKKNGRNQCIIA